MTAPFDTAFMVLNTFARLGILVIVCIKLTQYRQMFLPCERIGLGVCGGAGFMTIPAIWLLHDNPFEYWAGALFGLGVFVYFCGRMSRHIKHRKGNNAMIAAGRDWQAHRGEP